jgi:hypothetical protein
MPRFSNLRGRDHSVGVASHNDREPAGAPSRAPRPAIESKVHELMRLGLKVHDIAGLLGLHPRVIKEVRS